MSIEWINQFRCRCSGISKMNSSSKSNPCLTEIQCKELKELEAKPVRTAKQNERVAELLVKQENGKKIILSDTCIEYLMTVYAWETQGMISVNKESLDLMQMKKGKVQEKVAGALLSFVDDAVYKEHKERISNDYLTGEIDLYRGDDIYSATHVADIKNSWDYPTFLKKINVGVENGQTEQLQGYGDITGSKNLTVANCLVDADDGTLEDMKWRVAKKFNAITIESPEFLEEWKKWEKSMKFGHIPPNQRVYKIAIQPFTDFERLQIYDKVKVCREWLWNFNERYENLNQ